MLSLKERLELLEGDLRNDPPNFVMNADLPFAVFRYDPFHPDEGEWRMRREIQNLKVRVQNQTNRSVTILPMSQLFWQSIEESEGLDELVKLELQQGFAAAQEQVTTYLSDQEFRCLPDLLVERAGTMDPGKEFLFMTRADVFAPSAYRISALMEQMKGRIQVPAVLFYPGSWSGSLNYMGMRTDEEPLGSYRLKIYGRE